MGLCLTKEERLDDAFVLAALSCNQAKMEKLLEEGANIEATEVCPPPPPFCACVCNFLLVGGQPSKHSACRPCAAHCCHRRFRDCQFCLGRVIFLSLT